MRNKPSFISYADWECLTSIYSDDELVNVVKRIEDGYPIQYIIGNVEFLNTKILVDENVLIPRFETELLVSKLSKYIEKYDLDDGNLYDLCTGSGCIAVALKKRFNSLNVYAIDNSSGALGVAKKNANLNEVDVKLIESNVLTLHELNPKASVIVSNPPYVKEDEYVTPSTKYEPQSALYPGSDDILFYKEILKNTVDSICEKSIIAFEIGATQASKIVEEAFKYYPNSRIEVIKDYNDFDRFIFIFNNCE